MQILNPETLDISIRLGVAVLLGLLIGLERLFAGKTAGMRTYALTSMGAALFIVVSELITAEYLGKTVFDPLRVASQVVVGIGFLGAGLIIMRDTKVIGITSASGLWVSAGIGMAAGFKLYDLAIIATVLTLFIFTVLWFVEAQIKRITGTRQVGVDEAALPSHED